MCTNTTDKMIRSKVKLLYYIDCDELSLSATHNNWPLKSHRVTSLTPFKVTGRCKGNHNQSQNVLENPGRDPIDQRTQNPRYGRLASWNRCVIKRRPQWHLRNDSGGPTNENGKRIPKLRTREQETSIAPHCPCAGQIKRVRYGVRYVIMERRDFKYYSTF